MRPLVRAHQKRTRDLLAYLSDLEERLAALEDAHSPKEAQRSNGTTEKLHIG